MTRSTSAARLDFIAAGGNRHPSAADWSHGLLAFGAGNNIALWDPDDESLRGTIALLTGHSDHVNAVKIHEVAGKRLLISGGADKSVRIWQPTGQAYPPFSQSCCLDAHTSSINAIALLPGSRIFATGSADGTVKIWELGEDSAKLVQSISLKPRYLPLTAAFSMLDDGTSVLAVAGTSTSIQLYARPEGAADFELQATLAGHESWIRSLDFARTGKDLLLASASQDKYVRLWRFRKGENAETAAADSNIDPSVNGAKKSLSNKAHQVGSTSLKYSVTFEALLIGHEDWIYTAKWAPKESETDSPTLLSASADNSLAIWTADPASGVWVCNARLGEISSQKGSTSATGSTGGFWVGLWRPDGHAVVSLGRTGSWRKWHYNTSSDVWQPHVGISGHTQEVQSLAWAPDGSYLLTTGTDQTTRLWAEWKRDDKTSWHELARPQIHGYDLNCLDSLTTNQFVSGADEKLLRVFNKPKAIDNLLSRLSGTEPTVSGGLADAANIPVLGLSNKAIAAAADDEPTNGVVDGDANEREVVDPSSVVHKSTLDIHHPPLEDQLARHTLWPEHEKLYGHGYEISAVAASHDGSLVATACKASSIDHAVIRLYETKDWREVKPPLTAHSLTVTSLSFSQDDRMLLSVGRDRQWAVFERDAEEPTRFRLLTSNPKGHARMILDCAWAPTKTGYVFGTAGRDKAVKLWRLENGSAECVVTIAAAAPVTALAYLPSAADNAVWLAYGTENGVITVVQLDGTCTEMLSSSPLEPSLSPALSVTRLCWRPDQNENRPQKQLAVASDDGSIRMVNFGG